MYPLDFLPGVVAVSDINNDSHLDIIVATHNRNVAVLRGYGDGFFENQILYSTDSRTDSLVVDDFNNDHRLDIIFIDGTLNNVGILLGYMNKTFVYERTLITGNGSRPRSLIIDDFNNDQHMDIVVVNSGTNQIGIFLGYGNHSFTHQITYSTGALPWSIAAADLNNDTHLDLVVVHRGADNVGIFLGYGNGSFSSEKIFMTGIQSQPYSVAIADFDNDTFVDIIIANYDANNVGIFRGYGNGTFSDMVAFSTDYGSRPFFLAVGDFNNDEKLDFIVANEGSDSLKLFLQTC
jgi:hypothetical protein